MRSEGLCYDWVYKNLYWTDTISDRIMISNAANVSKILYENSDPQCTSNQYLDDAADNVCIDEPRSIIAHPQMVRYFSNCSSSNNLPSVKIFLQVKNEE